MKRSVMSPARLQVIVYRVVMWLLMPQSAEVWHPESPGMKVKVTRTRLGRMFKPSAFATIGECLKSGVNWKTKANYIYCPVCGYYCLGKGGFGCIDKPKMLDT